MRENFQNLGWYFTKPYKIVFIGTFNKDFFFWMWTCNTLFTQKKKKKEKKERDDFLKEENVDKKDMVQS